MNIIFSPKIAIANQILLTNAFVFLEYLPYFSEAKELFVRSVVCVFKSDIQELLA